MLFDSAMNDEQRERVLPVFLADDAFHLAIAFHEPDTDIGYDYFSEEAPVEGDRTVARQRGDGSWVVNGVKNFQTNGVIAKLIAVRAKTDAGPTMFLVPGDSKGLHRQALEPAGRRLAAWSELSFEDCVVGPENVLGAPGRPPITRLGAGSAPRQGAANLGVGRAAFEAALDYAKSRVQGGKRIIQHQAVGLALADMATKLEAARALIYRGAWAADHPEDYAAAEGTPLGRMPVLFAAEMAFEVAVRASTLFGGVGLSRAMPLQKYIRDTQVYHHSAPRDIGYLKIAELLAGFKREKPLVWTHS
ncbi:MAG: acyl-CoA dehydrogenase [Chloroflexi bacterium]|nr:acyl-CoA dehydrogenase [Chloroflexota bacterium]